MKPPIVTLALALALFSSTGCTRQARMERHLSRANKYYESHELAKAEIEYLNVLKLKPLQPDAINRLGLIYHDQGKFRQAVPFLLKTEELEPDNLDVREKMGGLYIAANQPAKAREEAFYILGKEPLNSSGLLLLSDSSRTTNEIAETMKRLESIRQKANGQSSFHLALGGLYWRQKDVQKAETEFKAAQTADPKSFRASLALGKLYWAQTNLVEADKAFKTAADLSPDDPSPQLAYADFKWKTGKTDEAKTLLNAIVKAKPDFFQASAALAQIAASEKRFDECADLVKKVLEHDPSNLDMLLLQGRLHLAKNEPDKAIEQFDRLDNQFPGVPLIEFQLAVAHLLNRDATKALSSLNKALALNPDYSDAILLRAEINLRKGNAGSAINDLTALIKRQPEIQRAHLLLADAYRAQNNLDQALSVYLGAMKLFPENGLAPFLAGLTLRQQGKADEAAQAFENTLKLAPNFLPAVNQLVELDLSQKRFGEAGKRVDAQIEKNPKAAGPRILQAKVYVAQTNLDAAEKSLLKAIDLEPNFTDAYFMLSALYVQSDQYKEALEKLNGVLAKNPNDVTSLMQIAMIHERTKDYEKARDAYEKLLAVNNQFSPALNNLAYLYSERFNDVDKAYDLARRARELMPLNPAAADTFGWILYRRGDYAWALSLLQESADKLPAEPEVAYHLGMAHYMMGEEGLARASLERALQLSKDFNGHEKAADALAILNFDSAKADPAAIAHLQEDLAKQPKDMIALLRLGAAYEQKSDWDKARGAYENAQKLNPKAVQPIVQLAQLYAGPLHDLQKALTLARDARGLAADNLELTHLLGQLAYRSGDYPWSLSLLQECNRKEPADPNVLYDLALAQYAMGNVADAETDIQNALKSGNLKTEATAKAFLNMLAVSRDPAMPQAKTQVQACLQSNPDLLAAEFAQGRIAELENNPTAAAGIYEKILARDRYFSPAVKYLARIYAGQKGNEQKAYDMAAKAREMLPKDTEVAETLGKIVYARGDYARAAQLLTECAAQPNADADIYYWLGLARYKLQQKPQTKQALEKALTLDQSAPFASDAKRILAEIGTTER